ncbi:MULTISPECIES: Rrf2 family transcriptional regulator [Methylobacter]|jgi:Rrf2 family transcriptional regulator, nitric oxide-sensitive transcriptional repressor|uniref:Rrf2 family transcriptional regulator n=1 Tax=Methylobacter TaxID=429 RepID=UPI00037FFEDA|nr:MULTISPECIES: Rrf2 family transcriptional regulator [Methylobacter]
MQLTQFTDYSLRLLIYLARLPEPGMATISEIAEYYQVSRNHLVKVANSLANQGLIMTTRGKGGGIQLARPAYTIGVGEVIRLTEVNMNLVECFDVPSNQCRLTRDCFLKGMLYEAQRAFMAVLDKYSLADAARFGFKPDLSVLPGDQRPPT